MSSNSQNGITTTWAGGLNFNRDFNKNTELRSSYFYSRIGNDLEQQLSRQYFNDANAFSSMDTSVQSKQYNNHKLNFRLKHKLDTLSDIQLKGNAQYNDGMAGIRSYKENFSNENILENFLCSALSSFSK